MQVWLIGDRDRKLEVWIQRFLGIEAGAGLPREPGDHIIVAMGPVPEEALECAGTLVLVEPELSEEDRVTRLLAGSGSPRLHVVKHVNARIRAERSWAILLALASKLPQALESVRNEPGSRSNVSGANPPGVKQGATDRPLSLFGRSLGFVGFSAMAWRMAELSSQYGMQVAFWDANFDGRLRKQLAGTMPSPGAHASSSLAQLLSDSDVLVIDVPYSEATVRLIDAPELALLRADALLINTAHGRAIDEGALLQSLRDGLLAGVALDRFNYEPLPGDSPLREFERVMLTDALSVPAEDDVLERTAAEIAALLHSDSGGVHEARRVRRVTRRRARAQ